MSPRLRVDHLPWLMAAYVAAQVVWTGSSGGLQPCDAVLALLLVAVLVRGAEPAAGRLGQPRTGLQWPLRLLTLLALWATVVDSCAALWFGEASALGGAGSLVHATITVAVVATAADLAGAARIVGSLGRGAWLASALVVLMVVGTSASSAARPWGPFDNPNQLGYFGICMASLLSLAHVLGQVGGLWALSGIALSCAIAVVSTSRAAAAAAVAQLLIQVYRTPRMGAVLLVLGVLAAPLALAIHDRPAAAGYAAEKIDRDLGQFAEQRGYARVARHPQGLIWGASAGSYERFAGDGDVGLEIHSSWLHIPFSYGIVGTVLVVLMLAATFGQAVAIGVTTLGPAMVYGTAHMGLRSRGFWLVFAAAALAADAARGRASKPRGSTKGPLDGDSDTTDGPAEV